MIRKIKGKLLRWAWNKFSEAGLWGRIDIDLVDEYISSEYGV